MTTVTIYHNPRCSKSRQTLELLRVRGIKPRIVLYLETPPDAATLEALLARLGMRASELVRTGEPVLADIGLDPRSASDGELVKAMVAHPILIERPIVVTTRGAAIGRPPERVLEVL